MLEERARVLSVGNESIWVEADRQQGCAKCEAGEGCGGGMLAKLVKRGTSRLEVVNTIAGISPGDEVVIGLNEQALLRSSVMTYLVPILGMIIAALLAEWLMDASDPVTAGMGLVGLLAGFVMLRYFSDRVGADQRYRPTVLRRVQPNSGGCQVYLPEK